MQTCTKLSGEFAKICTDKKTQHHNPPNWRQIENMGKKHGQSPEGNSIDPIADISDNIFVFCLIYHHLKQASIEHYLERIHIS